MPMTITIDDLLSEPLQLHTDGAGRPASWALPVDVLRFLHDETSDARFTLETGAGVSTIVFALRRTHHTCVVPDTRQVDGITEYCRAHAVSIDRVTFHLAPSEQVLPSLEGPELDLVLIDGRHAFPTPFLDWYYTAPLLKIGGLLVVDDTQLWTGKVLHEFLSLEPEWRLEKAFSKTVVFRKLADGSHAKEWTDQLFMCRPNDSSPSV
jgi:predicted O-methyltransferase YrrM